MSDIDRTTYTVAEAADRLGVSTDAIRKRLSRGTLEGVKVDGAWRVLLDTDRDIPDATVDASARHRPDAGAPPELVDELRETIADLRTRLDSADARADTLIEDLRHERERADTMQVYRLQAESRVHELESRVRELEALAPGQVQENEAIESPENGKTGTTGISAHVETDRATASMWARIWHAIRGS